MTGQKLIERASYIIDEIGHGSISNPLVAVNTAVATLFGDLVVPQERGQRGEEMTFAYNKVSVDTALSRLKQPYAATAPVPVADIEAAFSRSLYQVDGVRVGGTPALWAQSQQIDFLFRYSLLAPSSCNPYWYLQDGKVHTSPEPSVSNPIVVHSLLFPAEIGSLAEEVDIVGCEDVLVAQVAIHFGVSARDKSLWELVKATER